MLWALAWVHWSGCLVNRRIADCLRRAVLGCCPCLQVPKARRPWAHALRIALANKGRQQTTGFNQHSWKAWAAGSETREYWRAQSDWSEPWESKCLLLGAPGDRNRHGKGTYFCGVGRSQWRDSTKNVSSQLKMWHCKTTSCSSHSLWDSQGALKFGSTKRRCNSLNEINHYF